jgi:hypothetical protein
MTERMVEKHPFLLIIAKIYIAHCGMPIPKANCLKQ